MRITSDMPKDGQFIAVWTYEKQLWSDTLTRSGGGLPMYWDWEREVFVEASDDYSGMENLVFIVEE